MPRIRGLRESAFWILAGVSLILLLALTSYSPIDPAFSVAGGESAVSNRMGPAGAWFADVAFLLFGETAYLFPILVLVAGVFLFRQQELPEKGPMIWRGVGFALTIATSSGLSTLHFNAPQMRETAGGILGQLVGRGLEHGLGTARRHGALARALARPRFRSRPACRGSRSWIGSAAGSTPR